jgi:CHAD domain-containing protein
MPYRFKINEPVEKGFRRIAREQLDAALMHLASAPHISPSGVHECRKALKRLRALVRLTAPALGRGTARRRTKALSAIARLLSAHRDQTVMLETLAKLTSEIPTEVQRVFSPLRAHFAGLVGQQPEPVDVDCAAKIERLLLREAKKFARSRFRRRGFAALEGGLEKSYRQARKAMKNAYGEPSDESFHTLRKAVQWHWRQMSLLGRAWPDEFAVRVAAARELSQMLGDDHDLAMLVDALADVEEMPPEDKEAIAALCRERLQALRDAAEPRAERLFAETSKAFTKRMAVYWRHGRAVEQSLGASIAARVEPAKSSSAAVKPELKPAPEVAKPVAAKSRLAAKTPASAPSQRRA